jgi:hypothetical protein
LEDRVKHVTILISAFPKSLQRFTLTPLVPLQPKYPLASTTFFGDEFVEQQWSRMYGSVLLLLASGHSGLQLCLFVKHACASLLPASSRALALAALDFIPLKTLRLLGRQNQQNSRKYQTGQAVCATWLVTR